MEDNKNINYNKTEERAGASETMQAGSQDKARPSAAKTAGILFKHYTTGLVIAVIILVMLLISIILPDSSFSEKENRVLKDFPSFSMTALTEGRLSSDFESYVTDQFPLRDAWIKLRTGLELARGRYDANGVYKCSDGYLMEKIAEPDQDALAGVLGSVTEFRNNVSDNIGMYMMLVPNAACTLSDKLPMMAPVADQNQYLDQVRDYLAANTPGINYIDTREAFAAANQAGTQIYYRTDHHWTSDGALEAFKVCAGVLGLNPDEFTRTRYVLSDSFKGTMATRSGFAVEKADQVVMYQDDSSVEYLVEYTAEGEKKASLYESENLKKNDKYTVFFGGNYSQVDIRTDSGHRDKLLIIKDSYANSFVPFLIPYYGEIIMVDPRFYCEDIYKLINEQGIDQVLFLYNANTFFEDDNLQEVMQGDVQKG